MAVSLFVEFFTIFILGKCTRRKVHRALSVQGGAGVGFGKYSLKSFEVFELRGFGTISACCGGAAPFTFTKTAGAP